MAVPHWIVQALMGGVPSQTLSPLLGQKTADNIGNFGADAFLAPIIGAADATGPRAAEAGTQLGDSLTGQTNFWNRVRQNNLPLQPDPQRTNVTTNPALLKMPFG